MSVKPVMEGVSIFWILRRSREPSLYRPDKLKFFPSTAQKRFPVLRGV